MLITKQVQVHNQYQQVFYSENLLFESRPVLHGVFSITSAMAMPITAPNKTQKRTVFIFMSFREYFQELFNAVFLHY